MEGGSFTYVFPSCAHTFQSERESQSLKGKQRERYPLYVFPLFKRRLCLPFWGDSDWGKRERKTRRESRGETGAATRQDASSASIETIGTVLFVLEHYVGNTVSFRLSFHQFVVFLASLLVFDVGNSKR